MNKDEKTAGSEAFDRFAAAGFYLPVSCRFLYTRRLVNEVRAFPLYGQFYTNRYSVTVWYGLSGPNTDEGNCGLFGVSG